MKKYILVPLALLLVVMSFSGCTIVSIGAGGTGKATGVIIKDFVAYPPEIYSGDDVSFSLTVENVGEEDADNVAAKLFGLGTGWDIPDDEKGYKDVNPTLLLKSQPEHKIPGGMGDADWEVTSPVIRVDNTYTAGVRLKYDYKTSAHADIKAYSRDYLRTVPEESVSIMKSSGIESFSVSKAPITVSLTGLARPIITSGSDDYATIAILIENIGQGTPFNDDETDMEITIESIRVDGEACVSDKVKRLPRGGKGSEACKFEVPNIEDYATIPVDIELSYSYFIDTSTSVKVYKSLDIGGGGTTGNGGDDEGGVGGG